MVNFDENISSTVEISLQKVKQTLNNIEDIARMADFRISQPPLYRQLLKLVDIQREELKILEELIETQTLGVEDLV